MVTRALVTRVCSFRGSSGSKQSEGGFLSHGNRSTKLLVGLLGCYLDPPFFLTSNEQGGGCFRFASLAPPPPFWTLLPLTTVLVVFGSKGLSSGAPWTASLLIALCKSLLSHPLTSTHSKTSYLRLTGVFLRDQESGSIIEPQTLILISCSKRIRREDLSKRGRGGGVWEEKGEGECGRTWGVESKRGGEMWGVPLSPLFDSHTLPFFDSHKAPLFGSPFPSLDSRERNPLLQGSWSFELVLHNHHCLHFNLIKKLTNTFLK